MAFAPVEYGPQVASDTQGLQELRQQQQAVFSGVHELGGAIEGGAAAITQGLLHTQALKATAAVKEKQAQTLQFIDSNPYVAKTDLRAKMSPEDYTTWHDGLGADYKDSDAVPMYAAAGALFDSEAKQARDAAGQVISLPGWRNRWNSTEQTESATIRERYVNRLAADQMIADQRSQTLMAVDKMVDAAVKPEDIQAAATMADTSPWLKPAERRFIIEKTLVAKDSFVARQALLGGDTEVMAAELTKLKGDKSVEFYPNMNVKQRLDLVGQLTREHAFKFAKDVAEREIVGPNVDEHGNVNRTGIAEKLGAYNGPNKEDVTRAVKVEEDAKLDISNKRNAEVQKSILRAGQNPMTGRFSYAKAMQNPEARKAAEQLNRTAPELLTALSREETRNENIDAKATALERREAKDALNKTSAGHLDAIHLALDDAAQSDVFKNMTPAQFDVGLYNREMTEPDRNKAREAFAKFQKNGGPDERAQQSVNAELFAAANGNTIKTDQLKAQYSDVLLRSAHQFIRDNPNLPKDKMTDALREHIKAEMLNGRVLGTGKFFNPGARRIEWETKPDFVGKDFKLKDGTVVPASQQPRVQLSKGGKVMDFPAGDAAAARADGWK